MPYEHIVVTKEEGIGLVTIHRPEVLNALCTDMLRELMDAFAALEADGEVGVILLTGEGRAFVAGADIAQMRGYDSEQGRAMSAYGQRCMAQIESLTKPVIAAVNGFALGGGCELALCCDIRVASEKAKFGLPEVGLGVIPGYGGTQRLPRLLGRGMAGYLIFTGEIIDAQEALRIGLVEKVVPADQLLTEAKAIAGVMLQKSPLALEMAKRAIRTGLDVDIASGTRYETEAFAVVFASDDRKEGMSAFLEKRPAVFRSTRAGREI